ncbi:VC0807 family protein [Parageobacillus toebii]|uniref:VC0807 family protein n=1 Tax=Parageobacillus toebii TaxID=153151 RepID=UPI002E24C1A0|nr:hypothetical protein [Parageobacillus toebii]
MSKQVVLLDVVCYIIFPLVVWYAARGHIGDYYAMLVSAVPGMVYTVYRFFSIRRINFFGIFMIANLVIGTLLDVLAGSALQMLWNGVYYSVALAILFLATMAANKPIVLYISLDFVEMQGANRQVMKQRFFQKDVLSLFQWITLAFALRDLLLAAIKAWLIVRYGVEAFDKARILRQAISWGIYGLCFIGFARISKLINAGRQEQSSDDFETYS